MNEKEQALKVAEIGDAVASKGKYEGSLPILGLKAIVPALKVQNLNVEPKKLADKEIIHFVVTKRT